jgi:2-phosphosulfolactate phosphatase
VTGIGFEWGPAGAAAIAGDAEVVAVVDVLSFTTTLTCAVERGIAVLPFRWGAEEAAQAARRHDATLAGGRSNAGGVSLSPASLLRSTGIERLVLPSPNGSAISAQLAATGAQVIGVSLRNATAAAAWVGNRTVAVVAAGERWPDGSLRPALEDLWGAGAFIAALRSTGRAGRCTEEARSALVAYENVGDLDRGLRSCRSGLELIGRGFAGDVTVAGQLDSSPAVPVLSGGWFVRG